MKFLKLRKWLVELYYNMFNWKFAVFSMVFNGGFAVWANLSFEPREYGRAGLTQVIASFFLTGFTARVVQHFSPLKSVFASYFWGSLIPATITFVLSFFAHTWNGTPRVLESCIAPTVISYTSSYVTNYITRGGKVWSWLLWFRPKNYKGD